MSIENDRIYFTDEQAAEEAGLTASQIARARKISRNGEQAVITENGAVISKGEALANGSKIVGYINMNEDDDGDDGDGE